MSYNAYVVENHGEDLKEQTRSTRGELAPEELMIKTHAAGVCHTDLHFWHGYFQVGKTKNQVVTFSERGITLPLVPGHEIAGEVYAMGTKAIAESGFGIGDRVLFYPWVGCGQCTVCDAGEPNLCSGKTRELGFLLDGGYAEFAKIPSYRYVFRIPDSVSYEFAALLPCGALTAFNAVKKSRCVIEQVAKKWKLTPVVGVIGLGGLGQWALKILRCYFGKDVNLSVIGIDISDSKTTHLLKEGLVDQTFVLKTTQTVSEQADSFLSTFDNQHMSVILDFVNATESFQLATRLLHKAGILIAVGLHGGLGELQLPFLPLRAYTISGVCTGTVADMKELIDLVKKCSLTPPEITRYPMCEATKALRDLGIGSIKGRAVLIN